MRLQPLLACRELGFKPLPNGYTNAAIANGHRKFAESYLAGDIACKRVMLIEQINAPTAIGGIHRRKPVPVFAYGTKAQIDIMLDPFIIQVTNEPFCTENPSVAAWLRVGGTIGEVRSTYTPFLFVRDYFNTDVSRVDQFFAPIIRLLEREKQDVAA